LELDVSYSWYSRVPKGSILEQGDFISGLSVPFATYSYTNVKNKSVKTKSVWQEADWIILTQSCDLDPNNNGGLDNIVICPVFTLSQFLQENPAYTGKSKKKELLNNKKIGLHSLKSTGYRWYPNEPYLVNFRDARIVSLRVVLEYLVTSKNKLRLRLNPPYREYMAARFGLLFSRIGYPVNFPTELEEKSAMES
jgi:hypothetical protein